MKKIYVLAFSYLYDRWRQMSLFGNRSTIFALLFMTQMIAVNSAAQNIESTRTINGTITDDSSDPIPGVTVMERGTTNGTISESNGNYSIEVASDTAQLVFSFIGMQTQTINTAGRTSIDVEMAPSTVALDEVIAVGYGTVSKKNLTTSISKVNTNEIPKSANSNMSQLLMGRAAGLQATMTSAQPGGDVDISIRGAGNPIYVVDGVAMPTSSLEAGSGGSATVIPSSVDRSGLAGLNPEDIESIEVLKDASAAIYGIGAANGVILITTKRGKEGPLKATYSASYSTVENYDYVDPLNAQDYMTLVNSFSKERYLYNNNMGAYGSEAYDNGWTTPYTESDISQSTTTNWKDKILKTGHISNHNLSLTGGTKKVHYYVSGNYFDQMGTVSNSSMTRYALRSNVQLQLFPFLKLTSTVNVNRNKYDNSSVGGTSSGRGAEAAGALTAALSYPSYLPVRDENGEYTQYLNIPNAVAMQEIDDDTHTAGTYVNFAADIDLIKNMLTAKLLYGNNRESTNREVYIPSYVYFDQMYKSRGNIAYDIRENQTYEAMINFNKSFDLFRLDLVAGMGKYLNSGKGLNIAYDEQHDAIRNDNISAASGVYKPGSSRYDDEKRSQFVRGNIDFLDRYVLAGTIRRDGTDKFFPDKKYAIFPSVSMAWKMSNENFLSSVSWINLLKLRASYGETGNDNLGSTLYGTFAPYGRVTFDGGSVQYIPITQRGLDYPQVSWEKTTMKNLGVDFYVLNNRLSGSFDLFQNDITDMLEDEANTPGLSMFGEYPINGAHLRREGWDASITGKLVNTTQFLWNSTLTVTKYDAIWKERMPNYDFNEYELQENAPVNARYYYETSGLINAGMSNVPGSQPEDARFPGFPIIVDQNKDGEITVDDVVMNNEVPDIYFGFGNTFAYKNFDLDIFMYSQIGVNKYNYALDWAHAANLANEVNNSNQFAKRIWNSETNPDGTIPGIAWNLASVSLPGNAGTDINFQDASFLRVRNITLGYNLKGNQLGQLSQYISNIRIYIDAQNPLTFTNFEGFDPEVRSGGDYKGGKAEYPQTRTFSAGLRVNFN